MSSIFQVPELVIGLGLSEAAAAAFEPKIEVPKQTAWAANPARIPDIGVIASLLAGGKIDLATAQGFAARLGFDVGPLDSLTWLAQNRLNFPVMLRMWRRFGAFSSADAATLDALMDETLAHEQLDWDYQPWLKKMYDAELVGLGDIATAVVRGALPSPPYMPVPPPTTTTNVKRFPQVNIDPEVLAAALGFPPEMLQLMVARSGLSLAPIFAANAFFRGLIADDDFLLAIAEGDLRTEWAEILKDTARAIPTPGEYVEGALRGWIDIPSMNAGAARHGMAAADTQLLYEIKRRPLAIHQITTGLARGGVFQPQPGEIQDPFDASVHQADLGPEWYDIAKANKYTYPSAFVLRNLAQAGDLGNQAAVKQVLLEIGWKPSFANQVSTAWTAGSSSSDPHVTKAAATAWTKAQSAYLVGGALQSDVTPVLTAIGVSPTAQQQVFTLWGAILAMQRKQLTVAEIKKAYKDAVTNPATGLPWTQPEAMARLSEIGYNPQDAQTILEL